MKKRRLRLRKVPISDSIEKGHPCHINESSVIHLGDCRTVLRDIPPRSIHAVVCDPPYGIGFMGRAWDQTGVAFDPRTWMRLYAVMRPGAHLAVFGGTRTFHLVTCAIMDAGFEIRDCLMWLYSQGFPKSHDVSKGIDKAKGTEGTYGNPKSKEHAGWIKRKRMRGQDGHEGLQRPWMNDEEAVDRNARQYIPGTTEAAAWQGWGTALKPSFEPIIWAQKPLTVVPYDDIILAQTESLIGGLLCQLLSNAKSVHAVSKSSQSVSDAASGSALLIAAVLHGGQSGEWCEKMGTYNSPEMVAISLSIASSWSAILDAILRQKNTCTTETANETTTALKTLNSCLSESIPASLIQAVSYPVGKLSGAHTVSGNSSDASENVDDIRKHTAAALATLRQARKSVRFADASFMPVARAASSVLQDVITILGVRAELSPSYRPIILARRPLSEKTVAANVLRWGTGALNIGACRVGTERRRTESACNTGCSPASVASINVTDAKGHDVVGRWPANLILSHDQRCVLVGERPVRAGNSRNPSDSSGSVMPRKQKRVGPHYADESGHETIDLWACVPGCPVRMLDEQSGNTTTKKGKPRKSKLPGKGYGMMHTGEEHNDTGSASRFFDCAKASTRERNEGMPEGSRNRHPTVKPVRLLRYLCRLVTPPGGIVLDPFMGSGSTGVACVEEGLRFIGIDNNKRSCITAGYRIDAACPVGISEPQIKKRRIKIRKRKIG